MPSSCTVGRAVGWPVARGVTRGVARGAARALAVTATLAAVITTLAAVTATLEGAARAQAPDAKPPGSEPDEAPPGSRAAPTRAQSAVPGAAQSAELNADWRHALGARVRGLFVTPAMMAPYLKNSTGMEGASFAVEYIYRYPAFDVVTSLDMSFVNPHDGNYLSNIGDHPPELDTHYTQFRNLSFLSADVSIIGHHAWNWFELRYGAGLGLGVVFGDVLLTNNGSPGCATSPGDTTQCYPLGIMLNQPDTEAKLKATETGQLDTAGSPHRHVSTDKPPVMGVLNILVGANFRVHRHGMLQVEVGFRDAIFVGVGGHYIF
jgi:hypothetical protein